MDLPLNPEFPYYLAEKDLQCLGDRFQKGTGVDWGRFLFFAAERSVTPGEVLIRQFDNDSIVYILTHGELEVHLSTSITAKTRPIAVVEPIAVIGEQSFLDDGPRTASVIARSRCTVYSLTRAGFEDLRAAEPDVAWAFLLDIARSLSRRSRVLLSSHGD